MKTKNSVAVVNEYVNRLSDDDLGHLVQKLTAKIAGDRADAALLFQQDKEIDRWLCAASSAEDWFDRVDMIEEAAVAELNRRDI